MSVHASAWAWQQDVRYPTLKLVLVALADHADDTGANAFPGVARLAAKTGVPERTVKRALAALRDDGLITAERRTDDAGHRRSDSYRLELEAPDYPPPPPDEEAPEDGPESQGATVAPWPRGHGAMGPSGREPRGQRARVNEPSIEPSEQQHPPNPPRGGRQRERKRYEDELEVWAAHHFPDVHVGYVRSALANLRPGAERSADAIRADVERWAESTAVDRKERAEHPALSR